MALLELLLTVLWSLVVVGAGEGQRSHDELVFSHRAVLDPAARVQLEWSPGRDRVTFRYSVAAHGYIGLGFSPGGGMHGADIVLAWVDRAGRVHVSDRHAVGNNPPYLDTRQDVELVAGYENDTHTVVTFSRAWDTCDPEQDLALGRDTVRLIWAFSEDTDPLDSASAHLLYHSPAHRGGRSLHLAEPPADPAPLPPHSVWDLRADSLVLPGEDHTHYWCKIHRAPELAAKHHMIALEPLVQPGHESYVHHMVLYECHIPPELRAEAGGATSADWFERHVSGPGQPCYSPNMPAEWSFCLATNAWAWAVGSAGERLPEHTGMPLGEAWGGATYFMLETHYDNPALHAPLVDSSGLRVRYTAQLRQYDTGMLLVGSEVNFLQFVPPRQPSFVSTGHCTADCTAAGLPEQGIKIISGVLHSHLAGRKMRLRHVRHGIELPTVLEDDSYDFNFQASRVPPRETIVLPGDELVLECEYETLGRGAPTWGGLSTREEMCLVFVLYYPRTQLADCRSLPALHTFTRALGIRDIYGHSFEKLVDFMKDIGSREPGGGGGGGGGGDSLTSLLQSLALETGYTLPTVPAPPSAALAAPLTEEELLNLPFYAVESQEPELRLPETANYRTLLLEMLVKVRIRAPASLHNKTIGQLFQQLDWAQQGRHINSALVTGEHNSLCLAHGRRPLRPYQPFTPAPFKPLERPARSCPGHAPRPRAQPSYQDLFSVAPLRSSSMASSLSQATQVILGVIISCRCLHL